MRSSKSVALPTELPGQGSSVSLSGRPAEVQDRGKRRVGRHPASGTTCPGYFTVEHDDRIGALRLPAGQYRITLLATGTLTCAQAASRFASFLQDFDGRLPRPWTLDASTGTFQSGYHVGFRVKEAVGTAPSRTPAGTHPSDGTRCPGTFKVQHDDLIGALRLPAGPYVITARGLSCCRGSASSWAAARCWGVRPGLGWRRWCCSMRFSRAASRGWWPTANIWRRRWVRWPT